MSSFKQWKIGRWRGMAFRLLGIGLLGLVILAVDVRSEWPVREVRIEIRPLPDHSFLIGEEDILDELKRTEEFPVVGRSFRAVDLAIMEELLEKNPFIRGAEVYLDSWNRLGIRVEQRRPVVRVMSERGEQYYLDGEGNKLPLSRHVAIRVITATGHYPPYTSGFMAQDHALADLFHLCLELEQDPFLKAFFVQVHADAKGSFTLVPVVGDQKITFGEWADASEKWKKLKAFYREAMPYVGWRKYRNLDLRFRQQVVCQ